MNAKEVRDVLELQVLLCDHGHDAVSREPNMLAALVEWKHADDGKVDIEPAKPKPKRGKAKAAEVPDDTTESNDSDDEEPF